MKHELKNQTLLQKYSWRKVFALLLSVLTISACSKKEEGTGIGRDNGGSVAAWAQSSGIVKNGTIRADASQQTDFQDGVAGYVDAVLDSSTNLGYVSATGANNTGVGLGGRVELQSGVLNSATTAMVNVRVDSKLYVEIRDEFTGRADSTGAVTPAIARGYAKSSGYVQGNHAYLKFTEVDKDGRTIGTVTMDGTFSNSTFTGNFAYQNSVNFDGQSPWSGTIGQFNVPTCQFFRCQ